jgi:dCTP deaminase
MLNNVAIKEELERGAITVDNGLDNIINDSILVSLGSTLKTVVNPVKYGKKPIMKEITIPKTGFILSPGEMYIGATLEFTKTYGFVPMLNGTDELAAMGIESHITAGFGDNGFEGTWTLEIFSAMPVRVYSGMVIGTISYHPLIGEGDLLYRGKYFGQKEPTASRLFQESNQVKLRKRVKENVNN